MKLLFTQLLLLFSFACAAQAKLVINGGIISINNGAALVIDNPDNTAIIRAGSGYIASEGAGNRVIWSVGPGNGNDYVVPFGNASDYLPLHFSASAGSAGGQMVFSTYPTLTWKNSDDLPAGVTNVDGPGGDNSAKLIDRFWQVRPIGYSTKPTLTNLSFTFSDAEYNPPNTLLEANLIPQRWNDVSLTWSDYFPVSIINTTANTVTIASLPGNELYAWWTLADAFSPLPLTLLNFSAFPERGTVVVGWQTASESNTAYFEVWRSQDPQSFSTLARVDAAGNSSRLLSYSFTDEHPLTGDSYYRLKMGDRDGHFTWSAIAKVNISLAVPALLYPNPAHDRITLSVSPAVAAKQPMAAIYDAKGVLARSFVISASYQRVDITALAAGIYRIGFIDAGRLQFLSFIKK